MRNHSDPIPDMHPKSAVLGKGPGFLVLALLAGALASMLASPHAPTAAARDTPQGSSASEVRAKIDAQVDQEIAALIWRRVTPARDPAVPVGATVTVPKPRPALLGSTHGTPATFNSLRQAQHLHNRGDALVSISSRNPSTDFLGPVRRSPTISPEALALAAAPPSRPAVHKVKPVSRAEGAVAAIHATGRTLTTRSEGWPQGWSNGWSGGQDSPDGASRRVHASRLPGLIQEAENLLSEPPRTLEGASALACLAVTIYHEARDQPVLGQRAVAAVVLRRVDISHRWGPTICDVVQPVQFSYLTPERGFGRIVEHVAWRRALSIAVQTMVSGPVPALAEADHYHTTEVSPVWLGEMVVVARIADHVFYRDPRSLR